MGNDCGLCGLPDYGCECELTFTLPKEDINVIIGALDKVIEEYDETKRDTSDESRIMKILEHKCMFG